MVLRFGEGTHVYLVGSTLTKLQPRDLDISIVVPDHLFWRRYRDGADVVRLSNAVRSRADPTSLDDQVAEARRDQAVEDWNVHSQWTPDMLRWGRESASLAMKFFGAWAHLGQAGGGWMMDLKIMPTSEADRWHKDQPRLRIDTILGGDTPDG